MNLSHHLLHLCILKLCDRSLWRSTCFVHLLLSSLLFWCFVNYIMKYNFELLVVWLANLLYLSIEFLRLSMYIITLSINEFFSFIGSSFAFYLFSLLHWLGPTVKCWPAVLTAVIFVFSISENTFGVAYQEWYLLFLISFIRIREFPSIPNLLSTF